MKQLYIIFLTIALASSVFAQSNTTGSITGVVTDSATGLPIFHANVMAMRSNGPGMGAHATTDSFGVYTINNLPAGNYAVKASAQGYCHRMYPTPVAVVAGQTTVDINFALAPITTPPPPGSGSISGVVTDSATGLPIYNAMVTACRTNSCGTRAFTDSNGVYTIQNLTEGNYQVIANARNYRTKHYPTPVAVVSGQTTANIDFALVASNTPPPPANPGTISGVVTDSTTGLPIAGAIVVAHNRRFTKRAITGADGTYTITNLRAGNYRVSARADGYLCKMYPDPVIVIGGANTPDINFSLVLIQP
jgi:uncharacterized surface anchored protein